MFWLLLGELLVSRVRPSQKEDPSLKVAAMLATICSMLFLALWFFN